MREPIEDAIAPLAGLVDAHSHTWTSPEFDADYDAVIARAWAAGLVGIVEAATDAASSALCLDLARRDRRVIAAVGLHPEHADRMTEDRAAIEALAADPLTRAIGEIGLDFSRGPEEPWPSAAQQQAAIEWQLELAREHALPVAIHARDADNEAYATLSAWVKRVGRYLGPEREVGMMHCFAGDDALAARYIDLGFLISVPGTVTFANSKRGQAVARAVPLGKMLVETDSPYLTPIPNRGKRNEPACVADTARFVAALRGCAPEDVARATAANAARLFGGEPGGVSAEAEALTQPLP